MPIYQNGEPYTDVRDATGERVAFAEFLQIVGATITRTGNGAMISVTAGGAINVEDGGAGLGAFNTLNFHGFTLADEGGGVAGVTLPTPTIGVDDESVVLGPVQYLNFTGAGVQASLDGLGGANVTIQGGGGLTLIQSQLLAAPAASIAFAAIPATFKDLIIVGNGRTTNAGTGATNIRLQMNGDAGANYDLEDVHWYSTGSGIGQLIGQTSLYLGDFADANGLANRSGSFEATIANYIGTDFFKNLLSDWMNSFNTGTFSQGRGITGGTWRGAAAVGSLLVFPAAGNFAAGTVISLYGRK